jgi:hypothetical protein
MDAKQLADKFRAKVEAAVVERDRQRVVASDSKEKRARDIDHCKRRWSNMSFRFSLS